jgi:hypothetical protein
VSVPGPTVVVESVSLTLVVELVLDVVVGPTLVASVPVCVSSPVASSPTTAGPHADTHTVQTKTKLRMTKSIPHHGRTDRARNGGRRHCLGTHIESIHICCAGLHLSPHCPQLSGLLVVSTHRPKQSTCGSGQPPVSLLLVLVVGSVVEPVSTVEVVDVESVVVLVVVDVSAVVPVLAVVLGPVSALADVSPVPSAPSKSGFDS